MPLRITGRGVRHFPKNLNQRGEALVGVMVAAAIGAIIAAAMATMVTNLMAAQNSVKFRSDSDSAQDEIRAILSSPQACMNTLAGQQLIATTNAMLAFIKDQNGVNRYATGATYGDRSTVLESMTLTNYQDKDVVNREGEATLVLEFTPVKKTSGAQRVPRQITIKTTKDPGNTITSCLPLAKMTDGIWQRTGANSNNIFFNGSSPEGRVGIGTVAINSAGDAVPPPSLNVAGDIITNSGHVVTNHANGALVLDAGPDMPGLFSGIYFRADNTIGNRGGDLGASYTDLMFVSSNGRVGIGTGAPAANLDIESTGNSQVKIGSTFANSTTTGLYVDTVGDSSAGNLVFSKGNVSRGAIRYSQSAAGATERMDFITSGLSGMSILGTGRIGIGTANPAAALEVTATSPGSENLRLTPAAGSPEGGQLTIMDSTGPGAWEVDNVGVGPTATFRIFRDKGVNNIGAFSIGSNGNVGVGTLAPAERLDVVGGNVSVNGGSVNVINGGSVNVNNGGNINLNGGGTVNLNGGNINMGYEIISNHCYNTYDCSADCTAGKQLLSGGGLCSNGQIGASYPSSSTRWTLSGTMTPKALAIPAPVWGDPCADMMAFAICANIR